MAVTHAAQPVSLVASVAASSVAAHVWTEALQFRCGEDTLVGMLSLSATGRGTTGLLVVVGGPQYRAGSQRQFTRVGRAVAEHGMPVLRFDVRGMGDSSGAQRSFEAIHDDIASAIDALQRRLPELRKVVLWGLCDGASASMMYWHRSHDPRVAGLVALNPWVRTQQTQAQTRVRHYYLDRLRQPEFWRKLMSGGVAWRAAAELLKNLRLARSDRASVTASEVAQPYPEQMALAANSFEAPLLILLSGKDYTAKEFLAHVAQEPRWQRRLAAPNVCREDFADADHTFSGLQAHDAMVVVLLRWLSEQGFAHTALAEE